MEDKKVFEKGEFIRKKSKPGSFMIFDGDNISQTAYKRLTLVCSYEPERYSVGSCGYAPKPFFSVACNGVPCEDTVDTDVEDFWIIRLTEGEKNKALKVISSYGYEWDEKNLAMIRINDGKVVKKIVVPDNKYHNEVIKPISLEFKALLKKSCTKTKKKSYETSPYYGYYEGDYGDE